MSYTLDTSSLFSSGSVTAPSVSTSAALAEGVYLLTCNAACYIEIGLSPTGSTGDFILPAGVALEVYIPDQHKISMLPVGAGATAFMTAIRAKRTGA